MKVQFRISKRIIKRGCRSVKWSTSGDNTWGPKALQVLDQDEYEDGDDPDENFIYVKEGAIDKLIDAIEEEGDSYTYV